MSENVETTVESAENSAPAEAAIENNAPSAREARINELVDAIKASKELQENNKLNSQDNHSVDYRQMVDELSDEGQKFVGNLRKSYTQKTQELAQQRKELAKARADLESQRKALVESQFSQEVQEAAEAEDVKVDVLDDESVAKRIEQEVARRINEMMKPMREEYSVQQRKIALQSFKSEHPDLEDYKTEIASELQSNEHINLEQAYWMVKGRKLEEQRKEQDSELKAYRHAARQAGLKVGGLNRGKKAGVPPSVKARGAWAIYEYLHNSKK